MGELHAALAGLDDTVPAEEDKDEQQKCVLLHLFREGVHTCTQDVRVVLRCNGHCFYFTTQRVERTFGQR